MEEQKKQIIQFVKEQKEKGYTISATLKDMGIKRPTYYSWCKQAKKKPSKGKTHELTPYEKIAIEEVKGEYPHLRHRQIQGILQQRGMYLSFSSVYNHLKSLNMIEPYERRPSPLKEPRYNSLCCLLRHLSLYQCISCEAHICYGIKRTEHKKECCIT